MVPSELSALPSDEKVFVDLNILTYHLLNDPAYGKRCREFIRRVENEEFEGFISPIIVSTSYFRIRG
jgi:predicted nucleic acid-binding protein